MLDSYDGKLNLTLHLEPLRDRAHVGWHTYLLRLEDKERGQSILLKSTHDTPLFLNWASDPEIPKFCRGIKEVLEHGGKFHFEPIDERDFSIEVAPANHGRFRVTVRLADLAVPSSFGWSEGVEVEAEELQRFIAALEQEYEHVVAISQAKFH